MKFKNKGQKISTKTDFFSKTNLSLISTYELSKPKLITKSDYGNTGKLKLTQNVSIMRICNINKLKQLTKTIFIGFKQNKNLSQIENL